MRPLGELTAIVGGGTPTRSNPAFYGGAIPWVTPKDMKAWEIRSAQVTITQTGLDSSATRLVPANSILIVVRSGVLKHTLPIGLNRVPVAINQDMKALLCRDAVDPDFLARFIKARSPEILQWVRATTADNFPIDRLRMLPIPLPPLAEQRRIATVLTRVDALRAKRRAALDQLRGLTQAILVDLVGDPVNGDRGWPVESITDIAAREKHAIVDGPFGSSLKPHHYKGSGIPVVRIANISKHGDFVPSNLLYIERPLFESLRRSRIRPGDVLISRVGTIGNTCIFPEGVGDALLSTTGVCKITVNPERVLPVFLHQALRMPSFQDQIHKSASTSVQKYFNLTALKSWRLAVPPMEVQRSFAGRVASVEILKAQLRASLAEFDALFATIQYRAFRGEL